MCDPLGSIDSRQYVRVQVDPIWLELILIDLGQIELTRLDQLGLFLISDPIKLFNLINPQDKIDV